MTIETKYNIGDEVWFYRGAAPTKGEIGSVEATRTNTHLLIRYDIITPIALYFIAECDLFPTKEELIKS
jgi:hypothetical protein